MTLKRTLKRRATRKRAKLRERNRPLSPSERWLIREGLAALKKTIHMVGMVNREYDK